MTKPTVLLFALILGLAACAETAPIADAESDAGAQPAATTLAAAPATTTATTTPATTMHMDDDEHMEEDEHMDDGATVSDSDADRVVEVVMTEFAFEPAEFEATAGETILFVVHNEGVIQHEFRITTKHSAAEHIESGHDDHDDEGGHGHEELILIVEPGETGEITVAFEEAGAFDVVACLLPGHYEAGMLAELTVGG